MTSARSLAFGTPANVILVPLAKSCGLDEPLVQKYRPSRSALCPPLQRRGESEVAAVVRDLVADDAVEIGPDAVGPALVEGVAGWRRPWRRSGLASTSPAPEAARSARAPRARPACCDRRRARGEPATRKTVLLQRLRLAPACRQDAGDHRHDQRDQDGADDLVPLERHDIPPLRSAPAGRCRFPPGSAPRKANFR